MSAKWLPKHKEILPSVAEFQPATKLHPITNLEHLTPFLHFLGGGNIPPLTAHLRQCDSRLLLKNSPPPLLQVTGALLSLLFQSSSRKITSVQGELISDMPGKEMKLRVAEFKLHNVAGLSIYLVIDLG